MFFTVHCAGAEKISIRNILLYTDFQYILHTMYWSLSSNVIGGVLHLYPADSWLLSRLVRGAGMAMRWCPVKLQGVPLNIGFFEEHKAAFSMSIGSCRDLFVELEWLCDDVQLNYRVSHWILDVLRSTQLVFKWVGSCPDLSVELEWLTDGVQL